MSTEPTLNLEPNTSQTTQARVPWRMNLRRILRQRSAITGMIILAVIIFAALFAAVISPYEPNKVLIGAPGHEDVRKRAKPCIYALGCEAEKPQHIMGLDGNVRDVFSRVVYGSRVSLAVFPGAAIMLTVLAFNLLGDGLRDVLDPRLNNS